MAQSWKIVAGSGRCLVCESELGGGSDFTSALYLVDEGLERRDFCPGCFGGYREESGEPFSFWRGRIPLPPEPDEETRVIPRDELLEMFLNVRHHEGDVRAARLGYLMAVVLLRRKRLKAVGSDPTGMVLELPSGEQMVLADPGATPEELEKIMTEVEESLGCRLMPA